jgi:hypothetical protein
MEFVRTMVAVGEVVEVLILATAVQTGRDAVVAVIVGDVTTCVLVLAKLVRNC